MAPMFEHCLTKILRFFPLRRNSQDLIQEDLHGELHRVQLEADREKSKLLEEIKSLKETVQTLLPEQGLNKRLKAMLENKNKESIVNLMSDSPKANFTFYIRKPTQQDYVSFRPILAGKSIFRRKFRVLTKYRFHLQWGTCNSSNQEFRQFLPDIGQKNRQNLPKNPYPTVINVRVATFSLNL